MSRSGEAQAQGGRGQADNRWCGAVLGVSSVVTWHSRLLIIDY